MTRKQNLGVVVGPRSFIDHPTLGTDSGDVDSYSALLFFDELIHTGQGTIDGGCIHPRISGDLGSRKPKFLLTSVGNSSTSLAHPAPSTFLPPHVLGIGNVAKFVTDKACQYPISGAWPQLILHR